MYRYMTVSFDQVRIIELGILLDRIPYTHQILFLLFQMRGLECLLKFYIYVYMLLSWTWPFCFLKKHFIVVLKIFRIN